MAKLVILFIVTVRALRTILFVYVINLSNFTRLTYSRMFFRFLSSSN